MLSSTENKSPYSLTEYLESIKVAASYFDNLSLARKRLSFYRWNITEELDKNLLEFESSVKRTGGAVMWGNDPDESWSMLKPLTELNSKCAFIPSKITAEIGLSSKHSLPSLSRFMQDNESQYPDTLFVQAKFIIATSGHVYFATQDKNIFEAVNNAKNVCFICGIDSVLNNGYELELAKNLYSLFEYATFGYNFELITKPGKPENRFNQVVSLLVVDHQRSNLLTNANTRKFFPLLNFELPIEVAANFWDIENEDVTTYYGLLQQFLLSPLMNENAKNKSFFYTNNGLNRLAAFLPYNIDVFDAILSERIALDGAKKFRNFASLLQTDYAKLFLDKRKKVSNKKFQSFVREKLLGKDFLLDVGNDKTFVEKYFYDKRKI